MGIKPTVSTKALHGGLEALEKRIRILRMRQSYVKTGFLGRTNNRSDGLSNSQLGSIHEFGTSRVPARPFLMPAFQENLEVYRQILRDGYQSAFKANAPKSFLDVLRRLGQRMVKDVRARITQGPGIPPPLDPKTVARKGSSRPLVDTGQLVRAIDYEVKE